MPLNQNSTFQELIDAINSLPVNPVSSAPTGNAQPTDVLSGKTFSNIDGKDKVGVMPNNSNSFLNTSSNSITEMQDNSLHATPHTMVKFNKISEGYITQNTEFGINIVNLIPSNIKAGQWVGNNSDVTKRITGTFTSDANAIAADIANGKTAYVNGNKITGTASLGGKSFATGTLTTPADGQFLVSVSGLSFQPQYIIIAYSFGISANSTRVGTKMYAPVSNISFSEFARRVAGWIALSTEDGTWTLGGGSYNSNQGANDWTITTNGFSTKVYDVYQTRNANVRWYAFSA